MSLLKPTPGECMDRLSILVIKVTKFKEKELNPSHFELEATEIKKYLSMKYPGVVKSDHYHSFMGKLIALNWELWHLIDRQHENAPDSVYVGWARQTVRLNDERMKLIKDINESFGVHQGQEKLHGPTEEKGTDNRGGRPGWVLSDRATPEQGVPGLGDGPSGDLAESGKPPSGDGGTVLA